jgi:hypothetical protein
MANDNGRFPSDAHASSSPITSGASAPEEKVKVYCASRASVPERPAMWRRLRDEEGWRIVSTWIDEAGPGETADMCELWRRIHGEIAAADGVVLYVEPDDFPLKGALVEVGMALGMGKPVCVVLGGGLRLEPGSLRPLGSWAQHPRVDFQPLEAARSWIRIRKAHALTAEVPPSLLCSCGGSADKYCICGAVSAANGYPARVTDAQIAEWRKKTGIQPWKAEVPQEKERHLDMLQADRLRTWARNIRESGGHNITQWGSPSFVADEAERIAADIEAQVKADNQRASSSASGEAVLIALQAGGYVQHKHWCPSHWNGFRLAPWNAWVPDADATYDCTCGLSTLLRAQGDRPS